MPDKSSRKSLDDLQAALAANDSRAIANFFNAAESVEAVHAISHLSDEEQSRLRFIDPSDLWRVLGKEAAIGVINGLALGLMLGVVGWIWQGNFMLGVVVAAALAVNTLIAVCFGGSVPLILRGLGQDPALASGPILTTVTDMSGFFLVLTRAKSVLPMLTA